MKFPFLLLLFGLSSTVIKCQVPVIFNQLDFTYKGDVKSVLIEIFKPRYKGDSIVALVYESGPFAIQHQKIYFGDNGLVIRKDELQKSCDIDSLHVEHVWSYHYSNGRLDSVLRRELDGKLYRHSWKFYYTYPNDSISYEDFDTGFKRIKRIKKAPNSETVEYLNSDSTLLITEVSQLDTFKRKERFEVWQKKKLESITLYYYQDSLSRLPTDEYFIDLELNEISHTKYLYNEFYDQVEWVTFDRMDKEVYRKNFEYIYDSTGNWLEKKEYNQSGRLITIYKQSFEYN